LQAWRELTQSELPNEFTSYARITHFPPIPDIPEHLRGRSFVTLFVSHLGAPAEADTLLAPLRALGPVTDTIQTIPAKALSHLHMDPEQPSASVSDGLMLATLPAEAIETLVRVAGLEADTLLLGAELFHIGGEMKRARPASGALAAIDAEYVLFAVARPPSPQAAPTAARSVAAVHTAMRPWAAGQMYLNLADTSRDPASFWTPQAYDRLRRIKTAVDPDDLIRANHAVPPYQEG
jgi:hypothetical protein